MRGRPARGLPVAALPAAILMAAGLLGGCEKETHRAARAEFQALMARGMDPSEEARALEAFVERFPEPKTNPYLTRAESLLADYHARAGRIDIAASWYERAVRASPNDPDLLNALGYLYASHGINLDRAVAVLEAAVRLAEERGYAPRRLGFIKDSLGWAHRVRGDLALAVALLEEACRLAPGVPILRSHLADAYRAIGEREKAVAIVVDLYFQERATDGRLRETLEAIGREGGPALAKEIARRLDEGLRALQQADRREAEAEGATLVHLGTADGARLNGSLFLPNEGSGRRPSAGPVRRSGGVLLLHALGSSRHAASPEARALARRGLVALTLDLRGHGGSVSEALPGPHAFTEHLAENLRSAEQDARAGLLFLERHPRVDRSRLGLVGAGLGALVAVRVLDDPGPRRALAVAILSPWGRAEAYRLHLGRLDPAAILLASGVEEEAASSTIETLSRDLGGARTLLVPGAGSGYDLDARDPDLNETVAAFLAQRLR